MLLAAAVLGAWACGSRPAGPDPAVEEKPAEESGDPPLFEDVTAASGLHFTYRNGEEAGHYAILESLGGGVALLDYDGDGLLDVFVTGGGSFAGPDRKQIRGQPCKLYRNLGGFRFKDVTAEVGLDRLAGGAPWFYTHGAAVADYDRDGWPDLLVTGWGRVALFHNEPDGKGGRRFVDVSARAGLADGITWATSAAWGDLDGDGWPDLYVCQYVNWSFRNHPPCHYDAHTPDVCPPRNFQGLPHKLYRNNRDGTFCDVSREAGLLPGGPGVSKGLGVLLVDVNRDGKPDVYVANDTSGNFLYVNRSTRGRLRFTEEGMDAGVARDDEGTANGSMGVDAADIDGSGRPWLWVTNYENELHALYRNRCASGQVLFDFHSLPAGIGALGRKYVGWGTGFLDIDHHGWEDLVIAHGHAVRHPTGRSAARFQRPVLLRGRSGKFEDVSRRGGAYFRTKHLARGVALGDLDNDGRVDLVISHLNGPVAVLRNVAAAGHHWLGVELHGRGHADVVGARLVLQAGGRTQTRFARGGGSYLSSGDRRHVFGLAEATRIERLTVTWPDGEEQHWKGLAVDHYYRLVQGRPLKMTR
jgi:hypothetical protein